MRRDDWQIIAVIVAIVVGAVAFAKGIVTLETWRREVKMPQHVAECRDMCDSAGVGGAWSYNEHHGCTCGWLIGGP